MRVPGDQIGRDGDLRYRGAPRHELVPPNVVARRAEDHQVVHRPVDCGIVPNRGYRRQAKPDKVVDQWAVISVQIGQFMARDEGNRRGGRRPVPSRLPVGFGMAGAHGIGTRATQLRSRSAHPATAST